MTAKIIADIGINHQGDLQIAKRIATASKLAGCDYVKLQKRNPDWCYSPEELEQPCDSPWGKTISDKVRGRELSWEEIEQFDAHCKEIDIQWSASCFDLDSLRELHRRYPSRPFNKIPSALALQKGFIEEVASHRLLTLISPALLTDFQLEEATEILEYAKCPYVVNHCIGLYPCPSKRLNLKVILTLIERFRRRSHCVGIGYSGHEVGVLPSTIAAFLGATWIERHVTLDRSFYGADHAASLEPHGLEVLVRDIRSLDRVLGSGDRILLGDEKRPVKFWRTC